MKIEIGKYYVSRRGDVIGPLRGSPVGIACAWPFWDGTYAYAEDGTWHPGGLEDGNDLVAPYFPTPSKTDGEAPREAIDMDPYDYPSHLPDSQRVYEEYDRMMDSPNRDVGPRIQEPGPFPWAPWTARPDVVSALQSHATTEYPGLRIEAPRPPMPVLDFSHEVKAQREYDARDYKPDTGKAPVVEAVFIPFGRTLLALAEMMERQKVRHKLQGAKDPFQEWRKLPGGKSRLANAAGRHVLEPWTPNAKDRVGDHPGDLHILHAIWGLMAAYERHLQEEKHESV